MRNSFLVFVLAAAAAMTLSAEEVRYPNQGISVGGGAVLQSQKSGGGSEVGFRLFGGEAWAFRSTISAAGFGTHTADPMGVLHLGTKFSIGGFLTENFKSYGYLGGGLGLFGSETSEPAGALSWDVSGGGGVEFFGSGSFAFFAEFGGGWSFLAGENAASYANRGLDLGFTHIALGTRFYL